MTAITGVASAAIFSTTGGSIPRGRVNVAPSTRSRTSWPPTLPSFSRLKPTVTTEKPSDENDRNSSTPEIELIASSIFSLTSVSIS